MYINQFIVSNLWFFASVISPSLPGECAPFYCSFDSETAITQCNGTVNGALTFPIAVNCLGANFNGTVDVRFTGQIFDTPAGSLSLWFKKNSSDQKGGIMEIGRLGTPNSMGIFYANSDYVYFEIRNSANEYRVAYAPDVLSQDSYTHIVVIWYERQGTYHMTLFINGTYVGGERLPAPFIHANGFMNGRKVKLLSIIEEFSRESLTIDVGKRIKAKDAIDVFRYLFLVRGEPDYIRSDNGPEFTAKKVKKWLKDMGVKTLFIEPGSPWENGYIESFNAHLRDELWDREIFLSIEEVRYVVERWRMDYNHHRPHSSLGYMAPAAFAGTCIGPDSATLRQPQCREDVSETLSQQLVLKNGADQGDNDRFHTSER